MGRGAAMTSGLCDGINFESVTEERFFFKKNYSTKSLYTS